MLCGKCNQKLSINDKPPVLLSCDHMMCLPCCKQLKQGQTQQTECQIECPICQRTTNLNLQQFETQTKIFQEVHQNDTQKSNFRCIKHPENDINFFCGVDQHFFCSMCFPKHSSHPKQIQVCHPADIMKYYDSVGTELNSIIAKAKAHKDHIQQLKDNKIVLDSITLYESMKKLEEFLKTPFTNEDSDIKWFNLQDSKPSYFKFDSLIFKEDKATENLLGLLEEPKEIKLLYRGSRDGLTCQQFHSNCDNQGKTLSVVKSERGRIFGGFTDIDWKSENDKTAYKGQGNTFLFLIEKDDSVLNFKHDNEGKDEIQCRDSRGPCFCGHDRCELVIMRDDPKQGFSDIQGNFEQVNGIRYLDDGNEWFQIAEIEVFQIS